VAALNGTLGQRLERLRAGLAELGSLVVGLSGGVDSLLLAKVAHGVLGDRMLAVTADSPSLPRRDLAEAVTVAAAAGIPHEVVATHELDDPRYAANPADRCYFCRDELFTTLHAIAADRGIRWVAYGENVSDAGDYRPGARAAEQHAVRAPLRDAGLTKDDIRTLAAHLDLPSWNKPEAACLASRLPHGTPVTRERLAQVERAESALADLGFAQLRVRHHGDIARIEIPPADFPRAVAAAEDIVAQVRRAGFRFVTLDLAGYRRGSLNPSLVSIGRRA
jgi:pyridinium-3,5-biscarboxylic acid mononucleotide sulfurtransferase